MCKKCIPHKINTYSSVEMLFERNNIPNQVQYKSINHQECKKLLKQKKKIILKNFDNDLLYFMLLNKRTNYIIRLSDISFSMEHTYKLFGLLSSLHSNIVSCGYVRFFFFLSLR